MNQGGGLWREELVTLWPLGLLFGFRVKILSHPSPQALLSWPGLPPPYPRLYALTPDGDPTGEQAQGLPH